MNQEEIYDEKISPLMAEIIAICQEYKIPMLASFACPNDEDSDLRATSCILGTEYIGDQSGYKEALREIQGDSSMCAITVTSGE